MIRRIKEIVLHPLFSGSAVMIFGNNLANFIAYIYHLVIGRMLGPELYGELVAMISLIGLFTVAFSFVSLIIVKFISGSTGRDLNNLLAWFGRLALIVGSILGILVFFSTPILSDFLKIESGVVTLVGPILFVSFLAIIYRSFLHGLLRFGRLVLAGNLEFLFRLILGVVLIYLGYGIFGAVLGILISVTAGLALIVFFLRDFKIFSSPKPLESKKAVLKYAVPVFIFSVSSISLYSSDVILVKHFFEPHIAGIYASLSNLGKIIFYGTAPISSVMFPLVSRRLSEGKNSRKIFSLSLILTTLVCLGVLGIYWLFPEISIKILYGDKFLAGEPLLVWFGVFMSIFTFVSLFANYFLSRNIVFVSYLVLAAAITQIIGIWFFHSSIFQVITVNIISASFLLVSLLIYFGYETSKTKTKA